MSDKAKLILALVLLVVGLVILLLYLYRDKIFKAKGASEGGHDDTVPPRDAVHPEFPLQWGSKDAEGKMYVKNYQNYLLAKEAGCLPKYGADGWWGNETEACSIKVTGKNSITWDDYKSFGLS